MQKNHVVQVFFTLFTRIDILLPLIMAPETEYRLIIHSYFPEQGTIPTKWFHHGISDAAFQIVSTTNEWYDIVREFFGPVTMTGEWRLGPNSYTLPLARPSARYGVMYKSNVAYDVYKLSPTYDPSPESSEVGFFFVIQS